MTRWIDMILVLIALEGAALWWWRGRFGSGPRHVLANLAAGAALLLAMRFALSGASLALVGLCLFAGLLAHLADLRARWTR